MGLPVVKIIAGKGNSGLQAPGQDFISGFVFYTNSLPSGFSSGNRIKQLFGLSDAVAAGIKNDYSDETQATITLAVSYIGNTGESIAINFQEPVNLVNLCTYIQVAGDTTPTLLAASLAAAINLNTSKTGYSATAAGGTITITLRKGLGIWANTNYATLLTTVGGSPLVFGAPALGVTGVASLLILWYYHISEYFRLNPNGTLYVGFFAVPGNAAAYTYTEVVIMQTFAQGIIRQFAVYAPKNYAASAANVLSFISGSTTLLQGIYNTIFNSHQPAQILFSTDLTLLAGIANLTLDLSTLSNNRVSVDISQDGAAFGSFLWNTTGYTISAIGAILGQTSLLAVSDDIGELTASMTDGVELNVPAFGTGELLSTILTNSPNLPAQLDQFRYLFLLTYQGYGGVYINNDHTATAYTDQFAFIHLGRTWDKAARILYTQYLPYLKAKFSLAANGNLSPTTQATLTEAGNQGLDQMVRDGDLSGYTVTVPAAQPNLPAKLNVTVNLLAELIANEIDITSTFVASL